MYQKNIIEEIGNIFLSLVNKCP